jgi:hypothetical protein
MTSSSLARQDGVRWSGPMQLTIATADIPAAAVKSVTVGDRSHKHPGPEKVDALVAVCRYQRV